MSRKTLILTHRSNPIGLTSKEKQGRLMITMRTDIQMSLKHTFLNVVHLSGLLEEKKALGARTASHPQEARGVYIYPLSVAEYTYIAVLEGPHAPYDVLDTTTKGNYGQR